MRGSSFVDGAGGSSGKFRDDFLRRGFAYGAIGIRNAALRESEFAAAGASIGVETMKGDFLLLGREFREIDAGKFRGAIGVFQKDFTRILEGLNLGLDGKTEESANFGFVERGVPKSDVFLNDAAFGIDNEGRGQSGNAAVFGAKLVGRQGDGIVDARFRDIFLNLGGVIVVDIEADDLEAVLILVLQYNEVRDFGAARTTPSSPEVQEDDFASGTFESERLAVERGELKAGSWFGIANETNHGLVVLLGGSECGREEKKQGAKEREECRTRSERICAGSSHGVATRKAH